MSSASRLSGTCVLSLVLCLAITPAILAQTGSLSGSVHDELTATAVNGLAVELQDAGGGTLATTTTGGTGAYAFPGLAAGTYLVRVPSDPARDLVGEYYDDVNEFDFDLATRLALGDGEALVADFQLARGGSISGTAGGLAAGEEVGLQAFDAATGRYRGGAGSSAGAYTVESLAAATYRLFADPSGTDRAFQWYDAKLHFGAADAVPVAPDEDVSGKDLTLGPGRRISGHVSLDGVTDVAGASAQADSVDGGFGWGAGTDAGGNFTVANLPPALYTVRVESTSVDEPFTAALWQDKTLRDDGDPVDVIAADAAGVDFVVHRERVISGQVFLDADDDQVQDAGEAGLGRVTVRVYDFDTGRWLGHAAVDPDGRYAVGVSPGVYRVEAGPHLPNLLWESWENAYFSEDAQPVDVSAADAASIDFGLVDGAAIGTLRGRVVDGDTLAGIPGVDVQARRFDDDRHVLSGLTDAAGFFTLANLPPGSYKVFFDTRNANAAGGTDYVASLWSAAGDPRIDHPANPGDGTDLGSFELVDGAAVSGRVYEDVNGNGAYDGGEERPGVGLRADDYDGGRFVANGTSAADGRYALHGLDTGTYRVSVESGEHDFVRMYYDDTFAHWNADPVVVTAVGGVPQDVGGIDFRLVRGHEIHGRVFYDANGDGIRQPEEIGVPGVAINAELQDFPIDHVWGGSEADGTYVLRGVYPGHHLVSAHAGGTPYASKLYKLVGGLPVGTYRRSEGDLVDTTAGHATDVDLSLGLGGGITGTVRDAASGDGIPNIEVRVNPFDGDGLWWNANTDAEGHYLANGLSPGDFQVQAWDHQGVYVGEYHLDAYFHEDATPVNVVARSTPGDPLATLIDFDLEQAAAIGTLRGQVTGSGPVPGVDVQARRFDNDHHVASATTDANGDFAFTSLAPGSYKIYFETSQTNADHDTTFVSTFWSGTGEPGVIDPDLLRVDFPQVPGDGTDLGTFRLATGGAISGTVFPPGGETLPAGLTVSAQSFESGGQHLPGAPVDAAGNYRIRGLPAPATYRVQADAWGTGLVSVYYLTAAESTFDHHTAAAVQVDPGVETPDSTSTSSAAARSPAG